MIKNKDRVLANGCKKEIENWGFTNKVFDEILCTIDDYVLEARGS